MTMRYATGSYEWSSRLLFWCWWAGMILGVLGVLIVSVADLPVILFAVPLALVLASSIARAIDIGRWP